MQFAQVTSDGVEIWYDEDGKWHREDGPAVIHPAGHQFWWYHGQHVRCRSREEFERWLKLRTFW
jgi:hypothetical protein